MPNKLVNVYRGELFESIHYESISIIDREGKFLASSGDDHLITYWRSAAKPFQAVAVLADKYNITDEELAVMCASHNEEEEDKDLIF